MCMCVGRLDLIRREMGGKLGEMSVQRSYDIVKAIVTS